MRSFVGIEDRALDPVVGRVPEDNAFIGRLKAVGIVVLVAAGGRLAGWPTSILSAQLKLGHAPEALGVGFDEIERLARGVPPFAAQPGICRLDADERGHLAEPA